MAIATSQQIVNYYDLYRDKEIVFSKEILHSLRVDPRQIYVKCNGGQWPCIINSTSFQMAKIIIGTKGGAFQEITKRDAPTIQLRYCFIDPDNTPVIFFVSGKMSNVTPYMNSQDLAIVTISFTQRPPDDLIVKIGSLIEASVNSVNRREDRIVITPVSLRKLNIEREETIIYVQGVPRRCILRDLSFCGAKVILLGLVKFLTQKEIILRISFMDPVETIDIKGTIVAAEAIEGRQDIAAVGIHFDESQIPINYKLHINSYLTTSRKTFIELSEQQNMAQEAAREQPVPTTAGKPAAAESAAR
ncbi:MAG: PilZ domain-containing protein [Treponema sp.]|nr:PilZ domain-containing protein [Treponema sp.]